MYSPGGFYPFFIKPKHSGYFWWPFGDDEGKTNTGKESKRGSSPPITLFDRE